ncbi:MAG: hypothetical protein ACPGLY_27560 [Rubripirellula sp.]
MIIHTPEIEVVDGIAKATADIEYAQYRTSLWYSVEEKYASYLTKRLDGFLVGLLLLAMRHGENIQVKGGISPRLYYNLTNYYMEIMQQFHPGFKRVEIVPLSLDEAEYDPEAKAVVTGFSGGIDSWCCIADHLHPTQVPPGYQLTHLIFNNVGAHQTGRIAHSDRERQLARIRFDQLKVSSEQLGLEFIRTDSNLGEVLKMHSIGTHVPSNVSAALQLQDLFGKFYYASAHHYRNTFIGHVNDIAYADSAAVHLLSTESFECISSGCQHTRIDKTKIVCGIDGPQHSLNVCLNPFMYEGERNCSFCKKCCRTLLTLELLGELERFQGVFNLERWKSIRSRYVLRVLRKNSGSFEREIADFADQIGVKLHSWQRPMTHLANMLPEKQDRIHWKKSLKALRSNEESKITASGRKPLLSGENV